MRTVYVSALIGLVLALGGCGCFDDGRGTAPQLVFSASLASDTVRPGALVPIEVYPEGALPSDWVTLYADRDGDPDTENDQYIVYDGPVPQIGTPISTPFDTTGVPVGDYAIVGVLSNGDMALPFPAGVEIKVVSLDITNVAGPTTATPGDTIDIEYTANDEDVGQVSFVADLDGDPATTGDQIPIAGPLPDGDGAPQSVSWDTTGVPGGTYTILGVMTTDTGAVSTEAAQTVTVVGATMDAPTLDHTTMVGALVDVDYTIYDPSITSTRVIADRDGDPATTGDQIVVAGPTAVGAPGSSSLAWDTAGVPSGDYTLLLETTTGAGVVETMLAAGTTTLRELLSTIPTDDAIDVPVDTDITLTFDGPIPVGIDPNGFEVTNAAGDPVSGTVALSPDGTEVVFAPDADLPRKDEITVVVNDTLFPGASGPATPIFTTSFRTVAPFAYAFEGNTAVVLDVELLTEVKSITFNPGDAIVDAVADANGFIYIVADQGASVGFDVIVFDTTKDAEVDRFSYVPMSGSGVQAEPLGIDISADQETLYVSVLAAGVARANIVFDIATGAQLRVLDPTGLGGGKGEDRIMPDNSALVAVSDKRSGGVDGTLEGRDALTDARVTLGVGNDLLLPPTQTRTVAFSADSALIMAGATDTTTVVTFLKNGSGFFVPDVDLTTTAAATGTTFVRRSPLDGLYYGGHVDFTGGEALSIWDPSSGPTATVVTVPNAAATDSANRTVSFERSLDLVLVGGQASKKVWVIDPLVPAGPHGEIDTSIGAVRVVTLPPRSTP